MCVWIAGSQESFETHLKAELVLGRLTGLGSGVKGAATGRGNKLVRAEGGAQEPLSRGTVPPHWQREH